MKKIVRPSSREVSELRKLRGMLKYMPRKGVFVWLIHKQSHGGKVHPGALAGTYSEDSKGAKRVCITADGKCYKAHRLAFLFVTGKWPPRKLDVDHEDGDGWNNKWTNLRTATRGQNNHNNHRIRSDNKSGKAGVSWAKQNKKWLARVKVDGKVIHLGHYGKLEAAIAARRAGELKYFGKYAPK